MIGSERSAEAAGERPKGNATKQSTIAVSSEAAPALAIYLHALCGFAGFRPRIVLESQRARAVATKSADGAGIALLPESLARVIGNATAVIPLKKAPPITHIFALPARRPSRRTSSSPTV